MGYPKQSIYLFSFLGLFVFSTPLFSQTRLPLTHSNIIIDWWAASPKDLEKAPCTSNTPPSEEEMWNELLKFSSQYPDVISKNIYGIQLENENAYLVKNLETLLTYNSHKTTPNSFQKLFKTACTTIYCVLRDREIFSKKGTGIRLLYLLTKYGFNGFSESHTNAAPWSSRNLDIILMALGDFPKFLLPLKKNQQLIHLKRDGNQDNQDQNLAIASIAVYNLWDTRSKLEKQYSIAHEVAHNVGYQFSIDNDPIWLSFSEWSSNQDPSTAKKNWESNKINSLPSRYASTNPSEDFAESVMAYRYNPNLLYSLSPDKYNYLKETVFNGIEYLSENECQIETPQLIFQIKSPDNIPTSILRDFESQLINDCGSDYLEHMLKNGPRQELSQCVFTNLTLYQSMKSAKNTPSDLDAPIQKMRAHYFRNYLNKNPVKIKNPRKLHKNQTLLDLLSEFFIAESQLNAKSENTCLLFSENIYKKSTPTHGEVAFNATIDVFFKYKNRVKIKQLANQFCQTALSKNKDLSFLTKKEAAQILSGFLN